MAKSKSSKEWLDRHFDDPYVRQAQAQGYRSRACFKLLEIQEKDKIIKPGMTVVDLGSAPGGWSQVVAEIVGSKGSIIASDILPMDSLAHVQFIQGDFTEDHVYEQILTALGGQKAHLVISDMAPNLSGMKSVDQPNAIYLVELALALAEQILLPGGIFLAKVFQGEGFDSFRQELNKKFNKVQSRKPKSSRPSSREVYQLASGLKSGDAD